MAVPGKAAARGTEAADPPAAVDRGTVLLGALQAVVVETAAAPVVWVVQTAAPRSSVAAVDRSQVSSRAAQSCCSYSWRISVVGNR